MCHVKNKSCPVASQNSNIICNIISIQMRYLNQSQSLLAMCHLVRTLKHVMLNNCPFLIFFFFSPITLTRQWHVSTYNTNLCPSELGEDMLFIGSAPRPQALILLKIAAAARTYGLDLCSERRFSFCFVCFPFTMCHVKNKSCPVASQNSNIICNIISIQMRYLNQSQSLLAMCHLVRTLKHVLLNNCPFLIFFYFFPSPLLGNDTLPRTTQICVQRKWTEPGHFVYWKCTSSPGSHPT